MKTANLNTLPCFYFPTTVLLLDDNPRFLDALCLDLGESIISKPYHDPKEALESLKTNYKLPLYPFTQNAEPISSNAEPIKFDIASIHTLLYQKPTRFEYITTIVADYAMPAMNGLSFCQQVDPSIKKILLTAEADNQIAVDGFNQGIINQFVVKDGGNYNDKLKTFIQQAQYQRFIEHSELLLQSLGSITPLKDPGFVQFFKKLCEQYAIVEFYLLDSSGSFLLLNDQAQPIELITKTETDMQSFSEIIEYDEKASNAQVTAINSRLSVPYFSHYKDFVKPAQDWQLFPAKLIQGESNVYYCAVVETEAVDRALDYQSIVSYRDFS